MCIKVKPQSYPFVQLKNLSLIMSFITKKRFSLIRNRDKDFCEIFFVRLQFEFSVSISKSRLSV